MPTQSNRIITTFERLTAQGRTALIPYIMAGDPSLAETETFVLALDRAGADLIELGVPFSDPIADGPIIQKAAERALQSGTSLIRIIDMVRQLRTRTSIPIILMAYYNTILAIGEEIFCREAVAAGIDGVIVPDMPPEEATILDSAAQRHGLIVIFLLAPTSTNARRRTVIARTRGFIYYVSLTGITGAQLDNLTEVQQNVRQLRRAARKPVAVGFGIATPEQARIVGQFADGVIIGSALVRLIADEQSPLPPVERLAQFTKHLKAALQP
ncbi:MAG: tryptophan synthase subunit alpha [Nitrospirae bacterium]|nr:MAG: tryptophan synthase subunit alpha [Nitrospirota bacterium]